MGNSRLLGLVFLVVVFGVCVDRVEAQMGSSTPAPADPNKGGDPQDKTPQDKTPQDKTPQDKNPTGPSTVVAAPGSTVVVQPAQSGSNPASGGLIVAAPGSTVVVQSTQAPAAQTKAKTATPNTFTSQDKLNVVNDLVCIAQGKAKTYKGSKLLARAGAIDALGTIGGDATVIDCMVKGLSDVLDQEMTNWDKDTSEFICFHVVQSLGNLGWGAKGAISKLQLLRGDNVILDGAIDAAILAIKNGKPPAQPQGSGTTGMNMGNMTGGTTP